MTKKPPQGATGIRNLDKEDRMIKHHSGNIVSACLALSDPQVREVVQAKRFQDRKNLARLIPLLQERYGRAEFEKIYKGL